MHRYTEEVGTYRYLSTYQLTYQVNEIFVRYGESGVCL